MLPDKVDEIHQIYKTHLRGDKIDIEAIEARLGRPLANEQREYQVADGGVAVLDVVGVLAPRANLMTRVSGMQSTQMLVQQLQAMQEDARVKSAIVAWDSPGGSVFGIPAFGEAMRELSAAKPTVSLSRGTMASAAYWVGSAANAVYMEGATDHVGSIGVYARIGWDPKEDNSMELTRGKYKRTSINGEAPTQEMLAYREAQLDELYSAFVNEVATNRRVSAEQVLEHMADGRVFVGQQAINAGLVDGVSTIDALIESLATKPEAFAKRRKASIQVPAGAQMSASAGDAPQDDSTASTTPVAAGSTNSDEGATMADPITRESLEREHAALFAQVRSEFIAAGATQERERILAVRAQSMPGCEALIETLAFDGKTSGGEAAAQVLKAQREAMANAGAAHANDAPAPVATSRPSDSGNESGGEKKTAKELAAGALALARNFTTSRKGDEQ